MSIMRRTERPGEPRRVNLKMGDETLARLHMQALRERTSLQELATRWLQERLAKEETRAGKSP
jgi:hypothetical protein